MSESGSWQDWLFTVSYISILVFVAWQVLKPRKSD